MLVMDLGMTLRLSHDIVTSLIQTDNPGRLGGAGNLWSEQTLAKKNKHGVTKYKRVTYLAGSACLLNPVTLTVQIKGLMVSLLEPLPWCDSWLMQKRATSSLSILQSNFLKQTKIDNYRNIQKQCLRYSNIPPVKASPALQYQQCN